METGEISIPPALAKTKKPRLFTMSPSLKLWLEYCPQDQPLIPANFRRLKDGLVKSLKFDWIQDGLRHTFATFHYAKHKNLDELRHIMGNSPNVIDRFYKGVISVKLAESFWILTPTLVKNAGIKGLFKEMKL